MSPLKLLLLYAYYYGGYPLRRRTRLQAVAAGRTPVVVLFYHRIADDRATTWTTSNRAFARQIRWLARHFQIVSLAEAQRRIADGHNDRPCVSITFDDGYAENCREAVPLLIRKRIPCTYFVTVANCLSGEPFTHDVALGHRFSPNDFEQLRAMAGAGIEIGVHGYDHADLGRVSDRDELERQMVFSRDVLQERLGRRLRYFAFPFGQYVNLSSAAFQTARRAGYEAVCSAYGGYNFPGDDPFHLQRIHGDEEMIRLKNRATVDPRRVATPRFDYQPSTTVPDTASVRDGAAAGC
jgi:peptidoglycan/xylan/chitin deacetylase (PgdA/CDA1 family)